MSTRDARGFWPLRDLPVALWLVLLLGAVLAHPVLPAPRWLMIHLLFLGALSHAIMVWSRYFTDAVLHQPRSPRDRFWQSCRLLLLNAGTATVVTGVLVDQWQVVLVGATAVGLAVLWHGADLFVRLRGALAARFSMTVRYYVAAACFLPFGAGLGTALARGFGDPTQEQVKLAHAATNLLGWVGLTVIGTLITFWPTMLRTKVWPGVEKAARRALPVLAIAVVVIITGALSGSLLVAAAGLVGYLAGMGLVAMPFIGAARAKPPHSFPTLSVLAAMCWWVGGVAVLAVGLGSAGNWAAAADRFAWLTPFLAAGFGAQVLLGALSYLVPVVLGNGPASVRQANTVLDRGAALRVALVNAGLLACVLPVPALVRVLCSGAVLVGLASFLPLLFLAIRASHASRASRAAVAPATTPPPPPAERRSRAPEGERPAGQRIGQAVTGVAIVILLLVTGVALDPAALSARAESAVGGVAATGRTTTVQVRAYNMRFHPARVEVPAGNRLVIKVRNTDRGDVHDLVLESGQDTGRLSPGESGQIDVGVVGRNLDGWCSVLGHRQMGMVFAVQVTGLKTPSPTPTGQLGDGAGSMDGMPGMDHSAAPGDASTDRPDLMAAPGPGFVAHDASLPPAAGTKVHRRTFTVTDKVTDVAPGRSQLLWTYNGTAPGPTLHGRIGDVFVITLINHGAMGHSLDFHAGVRAPDRVMRTIPPGGSLVYRFTATRAGIWLYHCSSMPMSAHIANGLFGAVVIDPPDLRPVDRTYVLVASELYLGPQGKPVDLAKLEAERPDLVVFNGYANQYDHRPLRAKVGDRVRVWVLDAGPNRSTSFHVVGGQFDTVWAEGAFLLRPGTGGSQVLALGPGQGGYVELSFPEAGHYPFVSHVMVDAERGAHGTFEVTAR